MDEDLSDEGMNPGKIESPRDDEKERHLLTSRGYWLYTTRFLPKRKPKALLFYIHGINS